MDANRKTRKQIIDETAAAYTSRNRATLDNGACLYKTPSGCMCAVGRCCIDPQEDWRGSWGNISVQGKTERTLKAVVVSHPDELLKPEYRGHPGDFWRAIQRLHDDWQAWLNDGISNRGKLTVASLHKKWDEPNASD